MSNPDGKIKVFSTFTGIGGFEKGIEQAGIPIEVVGFSEIDKYAIKVYERHFNDTPNFGDITKINAKELPDFDCLVGGFPCQAFSIAGKRRGFDDTRGTLFFDLARILAEKQPMYGVFENVKGLVNHDKGQTLDVILEKLQELGYYCNWEIYNSKDFGVPQNRERVYLVCQNLRGLTNIGQNRTITSSERLIQSYLFQILLNNLSEVKKLQEHESKDSVLGYLIWKEINQSQKSNESENTSAGTTTLTDESISQSKGEEAWQNIATWLSKEWGVDLNEPNTSTISTVIKKITPSTTYTFSQMQQLIWLATVVLRQSQKSLWSEVLSDLTVIQEGTKYARINHKTEEAIVTESGTVHLSHIYQDQHDRFIKRHSRGTPRPEVFPIDGTDSADTFIRTIRTGGAASYTEKHARDIVQLNQPTHSSDRVYASDGISPALNTMQGGGRQPFIAEDVKIRRLTPLETERLQGFPDNWTAQGTDGPISDTQRYKMCGNAVTVNVVQAVFEQILKEVGDERQ